MVTVVVTGAVLSAFVLFFFYWEDRHSSILFVTEHKAGPGVISGTRTHTHVGADEVGLRVCACMYACT